MRSHGTMRFKRRMRSSVAQLVEDGACNAKILGSIPGNTHMLFFGGIKASANWHILLFMYLYILE